MEHHKEGSEKITALNKFVLNSRIALHQQTTIQNRIKIKAYCASFQAKINGVVEGENPTQILGLPNEVIIE